MAKIQIYGDSFADPGPWGDIGTWSHLLESKYGHKVTNFGKAGSNIEYSMFKIVEQFKNEGFLETDVIIWIVSFPYRLHLKYFIEQPEKSCAYTYNRMEITTTDLTNHQWFYHNQKNIEWFLVNRDNYNLLINYTAYLHVINSMAIKYPEKIFIILQAELNEAFEQSLLFFTTPNLLLAKNFSLNVLHHQELLCNPDDFLAATHGDIRINHMSLPNHQIFAREIQNILVTKTTCNLTNKLFQKEIFSKPFTTVAQIQSAVDNGLLLPTPAIELRLRNIN